MLHTTEQEPIVEAQFVPSEATKFATQAQSYMKKLQVCEPETDEAVMYKKAADDNFAQMVLLTRDQIYGNVFSRTSGDERAVEEIMQEVFLRAYKGLAGFRGDSQVETWLYRIAANQTNTYYRSAIKDAGSISLDALAGDANEDFDLPVTPGLQVDTADPEQYVLNGELRSYIKYLTDKLPPSHRIILFLSKVVGLTHNQIAEDTDSTVTASKVMLHRVLKSLREKHADEYNELFT